MGVQFNSSAPSIVARRQTDQAAGRLAVTQRQLSSLLRINQASDDAAGLAIAERFRSQILQFNQEVNSLQSGSNLVQTAEGGLSVQNDAVSRIRELSVQASNGTLTNDQRTAINQEAQQLLSQIDQVASGTDFNGRTPLASDSTVQLNADGTEQVTTTESTVNSLGLNGLDLSTQAGAQAALGALDSAAESISTNRASLGAQQNRLSSAIEQRENSSENLQAAESAIRDLDVGRAVIEQARNEILLQTGISSLLQGGRLQNESARVLLGG